MKIGIIGASGKAGNEILKEAKTRGHEVTAIVRLFAASLSGFPLDLMQSANILSGIPGCPLNGLFWLHQQTGFLLRRRQAILCFSRLVSEAE